MRFDSKIKVIQEVPEKVNLWEIAQKICEQGPRDDPLYLCSIDDVVDKFNLWRMKIPRVKPFYAVKANTDPIVLATLAELGIGFDCASKEEIVKMLDLGVEPERIIFANATKPGSHIRYAAQNNIELMTFDCEVELEKIKRFHPQAKLLLRIRYEAKVADFPLGKKFGVDPVTEAPGLIRIAQKMGLNLIGICFHVGSTCKDYECYYEAIEASKKLFDYAETLGIKFTLLDIGGGYLGENDQLHCMEDVAKYVNSAVDKFFPENLGVKIISEPGGFFVASAFTLITNIHSKKNVIDEDTGAPHIMYYTDVGVYGGFLWHIWDDLHFQPKLLKHQKAKAEEELVSSSIWGPTCDAIDRITKEIKLPNLDIEEIFVFENMGTYTLSFSTKFNGFPIPKIEYFVGRNNWEKLRTSTPYMKVSIMEKNVERANGLL